MKSGVKMSMTIVLLTIMLIFSLIVPVFAVLPPDIGKLPVDQQLAIEHLLVAGIVNGYQDGTFRPNEPVQRQHFAKYVVNTLGLGELRAPKSVFKDVIPGMLLYGFIEQAAKNNLIQGFEDGTFQPNQNITIGQAAVIALRAMGKSTGNYQGDLAMAAKLGIILNLNKAGQNATRADASMIIVNTKLSPVNVTEKNLAVKDVRASGAKSLDVVFTGPVSDYGAITFTIKHTDKFINMITSWDKDKTVARLTSSNSLSSGTYNIQISAINLPANSYSTEVAAERVGKIDIIATALEKTGDTTATVSYMVYNQYNEDITTSSIAKNIIWYSSYGPNTVDDPGHGTASAGTVTIKKITGWADGDTVILTAVDAVTGATVSKTLELRGVAKISAVNLNSIGFWPATTATIRLYAGSEFAGYINYSFIDQFGNALKSFDDINKAVNSGDILFIISDNNLKISVVDKDKGNDTLKEARLNIDTRNMTDDKKVIVTAVIPGNGAASSTAFDIVKPGEPWEVVSLTPPISPVASGDTTGSVVMGLTVKNQFGEELTANQIAAVAGVFSINSTGAKFAIAKDGSNKGRLVNIDAIGAKGSYTVTVVINDSTSQNKTANATINVNDARYPASISVKNVPILRLLQGASAKIKYLLKDQYGNDLADVDIPGYFVKVFITKTSGEDDALSGGGTFHDESLIQGNDLSISASPDKKGTYKLTAQIIDQNNAVISRDEQTVQIISESDHALSFTLDPVPTLYAKGGIDYSVKYAKEIVLTARDETGAAVALPADYIVGLISSNNVVKTDLASKKVLGITKGSAIISVILNTTAGPKALLQNVTVVDDALTAQKVEAQDAIGKVITEYTFDDTLALGSGINLNDLASPAALHFVVNDQFGGNDLTKALTYFVTGTSAITFNDSEQLLVDSNGTLFISAGNNTGIQSTWAAGAKFKVTAVTSNGLLSTVDITITKANP